MLMEPEQARVCVCARVGLTQAVLVRGDYLFTHTLRTVLFLTA